MESDTPSWRTEKRPSQDLCKYLAHKVTHVAGLFQLPGDCCHVDWDAREPAHGVVRIEGFGDRVGVKHMHRKPAGLKRNPNSVLKTVEGHQSSLHLEQAARGRAAVSSLRAPLRCRYSWQLFISQHVHGSNHVSPLVVQFLSMSKSMAYWNLLGTSIARASSS